MATKYIHYGCTEFGTAKFTKISNRAAFTKPNGGFWASAVDATYGWEDWCKENNYREIDKDNSCKFTLSENAKILHIVSVDDLKQLPKQTDQISMMQQMSGMVCLDFERLAEEYDAIEVSISSDGKLYNVLYGWDCDSIVIINPDIVITS